MARTMQTPRRSRARDFITRGPVPKPPISGKGRLPPPRKGTRRGLRSSGKTAGDPTSSDDSSDGSSSSSDECDQENAEDDSDDSEDSDESEEPEDFVPPLPPIAFPWLVGYPPYKENPSTTFPDLPPELRSAIYEMLFHDDEQHIAYFVEPPLAKAYPMLRAEILPEYLKLAKLIVIVRSNFQYDDDASTVHCIASDAAARYWANDYDLPAGKVHLSRTAKRNLDASNGSREPALYHIEFRSFDMSRVMETTWHNLDPELHESISKTDHPGRRFHYDASIALDWDTISKLRVSKINPFGFNDNGFEREWMRRIARPVRAAAWEIVKRPGFCGFTLRDLKNLAWEFRLVDAEMDEWN
ncbi:hypothetical protein TI39_contig4106g00025 [Zymoseptoria brevis]|uniref:Uncharacterized protein n=1 Tax=Zymoseptoria brevis TaxID=1047168 RepID=A0A0F4GDQ4_9PEZI|nr:hypothetical protein TI39_contig4106g00025 [Zymoseptoria brevis]